VVSVDKSREQKIMHTERAAIQKQKKFEMETKNKFKLVEEC
jgi:hypothetical protein